MAQELRNFTPEELLSILAQPTIGGVGINEISADVSNNGRHSRMVIGVSSFNAWATTIGMTVANLTATQFSYLELALKYYVLYLYKDLDIFRKPKAECSEDDYRLLARLRTESSRALLNIGTSYSSRFITEMNRAINADASVGPHPSNISSLIRSRIITDDKQSARQDGTLARFGDNTIKIDHD